MKKNKQPEGKTKKKTPEKIGAETRMRRHIHRLKPVSSEEINVLVFKLSGSNRCFQKKTGIQNVWEKKKPGCKDSKQEALITL